MLRKILRIPFKRIIKKSFSQKNHKEKPLKTIIDKLNMEKQMNKDIQSAQFDISKFYLNRENPSVEEIKKIEDEQIQQLLNKRILKREFCNDFVAISLKYLSLISATAGVEALRSELLRSSVDAINHVMLYFANKIGFDEYFSLKKYIIFIPAVLFTISGIDTFNHLFHSFSTGEVISEIPTLSLIPLAAYLTTITIETIVIYLNIRDVIVYKEKKKNLSFFGKIKHIIKVKKNPILLTILTENFITFTSTLIPIVCQLLYIFSPNLIWGLIGGGFIGFIQL